MKIEGEHLFKGPQHLVWELVRDPDILSSAMPGTQKFNQVSESEYEAAMNMRIGPVSGLFDGRLTVSNEVPPQSCTLTVEGKGAQGYGKGSGNVELLDQGDGTTLMKYSGEMEVGGKLAGVGQRLLDTVTRSMLRQGFDSLDKALEVRVAKEQGQEVEEYKAPTEAEFAAGVAKDMAGGMMSTAEGRMVLYVLPMIVVLVVLALVLSQCTG